MFKISGINRASDPGYRACRLCPRECGVDRTAGQTGCCGMYALPSAARAALHHWEEPCISGTAETGYGGSGTVFFSGCNLSCVFCQNREISHGRVGSDLTADRLAEIFLRLQSEGAHNINLVTAVMFLPDIVRSIRIAKSIGLTVPVIYNSGGYESARALRSLDGLIDIYLPDMKFFAPGVSSKMCKAPDYFERCAEALAEMVRQVGAPRFSKAGLLQSGVIVRHLMLPGYLFDSRKVLEYLTETYGNTIFISLMNQYTPPAEPVPGAPNHALPPAHYEAMIRYLISRDQENAYIQGDGTCSESFVPRWDGV